MNLNESSIGDYSNGCFLKTVAQADHIKMHPSPVCVFFLQSDDVQLLVTYVMWNYIFKNMPSLIDHEDTGVNALENYKLIYPNLTASQIDRWNTLDHCLFGENILEIIVV